MGRVCTICTHPERRAIDKALAAGGNVREMSALFRVSEDALSRHKRDHLPALVVKAQAEEDIAHALDVVKQLKTINGVSLAVLKEARDARDGDLALKAVDRIHRQIELQAKLLGELDERPVVNVLASAEWVALRSRILAALARHPAARFALAEVLDDRG